MWCRFHFPPAIRLTYMTMTDRNGYRGESEGLSPGSPGTDESHNDLVERLFREHNRALLRFLRARTESDQEAKEVAQEAYVRLLKLEEPGVVSYFRAFLFKTASNIAVDRQRQRERSERHLNLSFFDEATRSTEDAALDREKILVLGRCVAELPPKCRKTFLLRRIHGLSAKEIAGRMRISDRMVRKYLVQATVYCRRRLDEELGGRDDQG